MQTDSNIEIWKSFYSNIRRQKHCDLNFLHLLYRYALPLMPKPKHGLVIGCGDGAEAFELSSLAIDTVAIDISPEAVSRVKEFSIVDNTPLAAKVLDQREIKILNQTFDIVVSWSTLSYLSEDEIRNVLSSIRDALNIGGCFIVLFESNSSSICQPNYSNKTGNRFNVLENSPVNPGLSMTCLDKNSIDEIISEYFTTIAYSKRDFHIPPDGLFTISQHMYVLKREL